MADVRFVVDKNGDLLADLCNLYVVRGFVSLALLFFHRAVCERGG